MGHIVKIAPVEINLWPPLQVARRSIRVLGPFTSIRNHESRGGVQGWSSLRDHP
jgi:hypothetical protein